MGFGLLFLGYLFAIDVLMITELLLPACALMFYALCKLSFVNRHFRHARYPLIPLMLVGAASIALMVRSMTGAANQDLAYAYLGVLSKLCMAVYMLILLSGVREVAVELSLKGLEIRAFRNQIYSLIFYIPAFLLGFDFGGNVVLLSYLSVLFIIIGLIVYALNAKLLFDCYRLICMPDDIDMPRKPSRFAAVNEYRARKEEAERAAQEQQLQRQRERRLQRNNKKKRGKK